MRADLARSWAKWALILGPGALGTAACRVEWDAPEGDLSAWVTSNRYIDYSREAERGMALTVALVLVIFGFTFIAWAMNRRMAGQPALDGRPWPFLVTSSFVAALTVAWLVAAVS